MKFAYLPLIALLSFCRCEAEKDTNDFETVFRNKLEDLQADIFTIPDSIPPKLIIATFREYHPEGHSLLVYTDSSKTQARKLKYLPDSTVEQEELTALKFNEFKSRYVDAEYIVREKVVSYIYRNGNLAASADYRRTDVISGD